MLLLLKVLQGTIDHRGIAGRVPLCVVKTLQAPGLGTKGADTERDHRLVEGLALLSAIDLQLVIVVGLDRLHTTAIAALRLVVGRGRRAIGH